MPRAKKKPSAKTHDAPKIRESKGARIINKRFEPECDIDSIFAHPRNPRRGDVGKIEESIDENGFYGAIVVQESHRHILIGNHRWKTMKAMGMKTIPAFFIDVNDRQALKIVLADNRTNDVAGYDDVQLAELLTEIRADGDLFGTGFDVPDVANLLESMGTSRTTDLSDPPGGDVDSSLSVLVECQTEQEQQEAYEMLIEAGYTCRVLTL